MGQVFFHAVGGRTSDVSKARDEVDSCASCLGLALGEVARVEEDELRHYHGGADHMFLSASLSQRPQRGLLLSVSTSTVSAVGSDRLALALFALADSVEAHVGRTSTNGLTMAIRPEESEPTGRLTGLHWFQYFSASVASRWAASTLAPLRTLHSRSGAVGLLVGEHPMARLDLAATATVLDIEIRSVRARNPLTGEEIKLRHP